MRIRRHIAIWSALLALIATLALTPSASADVQLGVEIGWGSRYRPGRWNPVYVTATSSEPRQVLLQLYSPTDQRYAVNIQQSFAAGPTSRTLPLYVPLSYSIDQSSVTLRDANSMRMLDTFKLDDADAPIRNRPMPVSAGQLLVGVTGNAGTEQLLETQLGRTNVLAGYLPPAYLPSVAAGFDALDVLILNGANLNRLDVEQQHAIVQWVRGGGLLVLWPGADPLPEGGPLLDILPCKLGQTRTFTIAPKTLAATGLSDRFAKLTGRDVPAVAEDAKKVQVFGDSELVGYRHWIGFGQALVIPADVSLLTFNHPDKAKTFWNTALNGLIHLPNDDNASPNYYCGAGSDDPRQMRATRQALDWMGGVPGAGEFGFSYLAFALLAMMLVVGPVDWFVLKWMGHQPWTWVTTSGWIALVTLGAISVGHMLKSGDLHFRTVTLIDEQGGERAAQTTLAGIYSPRTTEYDVKFDPNSWWRPASEGAFYGSSGMQLEIACHQDYRGNRPLPLLINVWNLRFLQGTNATPTGGIIAAKLARHGDNLEGSIENRAAFAVSNVAIRTRDGTLRLAGVIEPGGTMPVAAAINRRDRSFATTVPSAENQWRGYEQELPSTRPSLPVGGDLSVLRSDRIQQMLKDRDDVACVYAHFESKPQDVKMEEPETHEMHAGMVRAIVPLR